MNEESKPQMPGLEIDVDPDIAQGIYANLAVIGHTETEFILDFLFVQPGQKKCRVNSRIVTSPAHAKRLLSALADNIRRYESRFGEIRLAQIPAGQMGQA